MEEMERMGLTPEIISAAEDIGLALEQSIEGLKATKDSLETQQRLARRLDTDAAMLYEKAMRTIKEGDEAQARTYLLRRTDVQDQLKRTLQSCAEEKKRMERMEDNVAQLERRAAEVESLIRRNISAKTLQNMSGVSPELPVSKRSEDPLLQKFRDLGID
jgi:phage shock protein A